MTTFRHKQQPWTTRTLDTGKMQPYVSTYTNKDIIPKLLWTTTLIYERGREMEQRRKLNHMYRVKMMSNWVNKVPEKSNIFPFITLTHIYIYLSNIAKVLQKCYLWHLINCKMWCRSFFPRHHVILSQAPQGRKKLTLLKQYCSHTSILNDKILGVNTYRIIDDTC